MTPPRDHDLHLVPREEPEGESYVVGRFPPRPSDLASKVDALQADSRESIFLLRRVSDEVDVCKESIGRCEMAIVSEVLPWQARAGQKLEAIAATLESLRRVVGEPGDPEAAARLSMSDMTQEQAEEAFRLASLGSGLCRRDAEREIRETLREKRIAKDAAKQAAGPAKWLTGVAVAAPILVKIAESLL